MGGVVGVDTTGALLMGVLPGVTEAYLAQKGVARWVRSVTPPARLLYTAQVGAQGRASFRRARPAEGRDLTWLVATGRQIQADLVGSRLQQ